MRYIRIFQHRIKFTTMVHSHEPNSLFTGFKREHLETNVSNRKQDNAFIFIFYASRK